MPRPIDSRPFIQQLASNVFDGNLPLLKRVHYLTIPVIFVVIGGLFYYVATRLLGGHGNDDIENNQVDAPESATEGKEEEQAIQNTPPSQQVDAPESATESKEEELTPQNTSPIQQLETRETPTEGEEEEQTTPNTITIPQPTQTDQPPPSISTTTQHVTQEQPVQQPIPSTSAPLPSAPIEKPKLELNNPSSTKVATALYENLMRKIIGNKNKYDESCIKYATVALGSLSKCASDGLKNLDDYSKTHNLTPQEVGELLLDRYNCYVLPILDHLSGAYHAIRQAAIVEKVTLMGYNGKSNSGSSVSPKCSPSKVIHHKDMIDKSGKIPAENLLKTLNENQVIKIDGLFKLTAAKIPKNHARLFYEESHSCAQLRALYNAPFESLKKLLPPNHELLTSPQYKQDLDRSTYKGPNIKKA